MLEMDFCAIAKLVGGIGVGESYSEKHSREKLSRIGRK